MRVRLNGWQRSWCVGAALLLAFFAFDAWRRMPTAAQVRSHAEAEVAAAEAKSRSEEAPCQAEGMTQFDRSMCEMKSESAAPAGAASAAAIRQAAEADIRERLADRQWRVAGSAFVSWLAIVVAVYGAGWVVGRVIRVSRRARDTSGP